MSVLARNLAQGGPFCCHAGAERCLYIYARSASGGGYDTEEALLSSDATKTENCVELAGGGAGTSGRFCRAGKIRDVVAAIQRRPARLGAPLD